MGKLEEKFGLMKTILRELRKQPLRRTFLLKKVIETCGSPAKFDSVFNWLKKHGYVVKAGPKLRDPYKITWKGEKFLAGLIAEEVS